LLGAFLIRIKLLLLLVRQKRIGGGVMNLQLANLQAAIHLRKLQHLQEEGEEVEEEVQVEAEVLREEKARERLDLDLCSCFTCFLVGIW